MRQYAEKLRREAMLRYAQEEVEIVNQFEATKRDLELNKEYLIQKREQILTLTAVHESKAEQMVDSMTSLSSKDFPCATFCDQGWKLLQNWIFSLVTD